MGVFPFIMGVVVAAGAAMAAGQTSAPPTRATTGPGGQKYLIEFGWDEPTTGFMREHLGEMERMPFDGTVYHVQARGGDGKEISFMNQCWGTQAFTNEELKGAEEDLRGMTFSRFRENFHRFNVLPGNVDWFADFGAVEKNASQAARLAAIGRSAGVLFDIESYEAKLWDFRKQPHGQDRGWEDYTGQVRKRGGEVMRAFEAGWKRGGAKRPLVVFLTYGYSLPYLETEGKKEKLPEVRYGLLAAFLDGMFAAAGEGTTIVEGSEFAYDFKTAKEFADGRQMVMEKVPATVCGEPEAYRRHISLGFGVWMDEDWAKHGWDPVDTTKNYFTPEQFERSVRMALQQADRYVWVYTEKPKWWTKEGGRKDLPEAYLRAVERAKAEH